jgi:hypothetical protein
MSADWNEHPRDEASPLDARDSPREGVQIAEPSEPPRLTSVEPTAGEGNNRAHDLVRLAVIGAAEGAWLLTLGYLAFRLLA